MGSNNLLNNGFDEFAKKTGLYFADAGFLTSEYFKDVFYPMLNSYNLKHKRKLVIHILPFYIMELGEKEAGNDKALARRAKYALETIRRDIRNGRNFREYTSGASNMCPDVTLLTAVLEERLKGSVSVLTWNKRLASDLCRLNNLKSCIGEPVYVYGFNKEGQLHESYPDFNIKRYDKDDACAKEEISI